MTVVFHIEGGLGKHIAGTAILQVIKKHHPKATIHVVCQYPDVFKNNPNTHHVHLLGNHRGFYSRYIQNNTENTKVYLTDPYTHSDYILQHKHLLEVWANQWNMEYRGETPQIYLTQAEIDYFTPFYKTEKPILVIQPNGGPIDQGFDYSWTRDIPEPTVLRVIEEFKDNYSIVHIKNKEQKAYPGTLQALDGFRSIAVLLQLAEKRLLIDSFAQHLCAAYNLPSTVCWVTTKPEVFGYNIHDNIKANQFSITPNLDNNLYQPFLLSQDITTMPYENLEDVFNYSEIINSLKQ